MTTIKFCGAAETVTGSSYLLEHAGRRVLVDCGLFQGPKLLRELNYGAFAFDPASVDALVLSHAHIDHSGLVPKLVHQGFRGRIHTTAATVDLLRWMLPDAERIQRQEVEQLNRRNARRGRDAVRPIYDERDVEATLGRLEATATGEWSEVAPGFRVRLWDAAHILGGTSVELAIATGGQPLALLFSGDIGPGGRPFLGRPEAPASPDFLVVESTYGDRERQAVEPPERRELLRQAVQAALGRGGNLLIPAFAVERTQELLYDLLVLMAEGHLPKAPVYIDSPLATRATEVFERHQPDMTGKPLIPSPFRAPNVRFTESVEESRRLERIAGGAIIIAASGMCDAGRIRDHLANNLWRPEATVMLVGYQASGTMGRLLLSGVRAVRIHGEEIKVRARIESFDHYSAHADRDGLLAWVKARLPVSGGVFVTHGEPAALVAMREAVMGLGLPKARVIMPMLDRTYELDRGRRPRPVQGELPARVNPLLQSAVRVGRDWHNDYAAFLLDFQNRLVAAGSDAERADIVRRLRGVLRR